MSAAPSPQRVLFPATLMLTMTASAFQMFAFAVLASPLIDDLGMNRAQLGLVGSVNTRSERSSSPMTGRLTDRIGARRSVVAVIILSAAAWSRWRGDERVVARGGGGDRRPTAGMGQPGDEQPDLVPRAAGRRGR